MFSCVIPDMRQYTEASFGRTRLQSGEVICVTEVSQLYKKKIYLVEWKFFVQWAKIQNI